MIGPLNNEIKTLENQINIHKVRLLFTFYDSDGKISSLIKEKGESGRPPLDFYEKGYKADDFFENIKFLYQDFNDSSRRNSQDAILEKSEGLLSISQIQAIVFYEKLVSLHFEFIVNEQSQKDSNGNSGKSNGNNQNGKNGKSIKRLICNQLYENGERLLDILKEAVEKAHYEFLLSDNEFTLSISQGNIKPVFSMIAVYPKDNNSKIKEIFQNTNYITYESHNENLNELIRQEEIIAQNIFTCFKEFDYINMHIAYSQEYIKKLVEFLVVGNNEEVLMKSFLGFRKNGVLIVKNTNISNTNINDEILQLASVSLSALNFISLVVSLIQTLDAALVKKIIEFRRKEKPLDLLLEEIDDIYYHIVLINPYIIKHTASITTWSIPEQLVLLKYNIVENIINTINSMYLNSIKRYNSLRDLLRKRF
jgi:hypothetical protein